LVLAVSRGESRLFKKKPQAEREEMAKMNASGRIEKIDVSG
jgi:hypothetical protein